jgi:hypothetical protein
MQLHNNLLTEARVQAERDAAYRLKAHYAWLGLCGYPADSLGGGWAKPHYFGEYIVLETPREFVVTRTEDYQAMVDNCIARILSGTEYGDGNIISTFKWVIRMLIASPRRLVLYRRPKEIQDVVIDGEPSGTAESLYPIRDCVPTSEWMRLISLVRPRNVHGVRLAVNSTNTLVTTESQHTDPEEPHAPV